MAGGFSLAITCAAALGAMALCLPAAGKGGAAGRTAAGPRGPAGPAVPLSAAEKLGLAKRIVADGRTAAAVQAACERAAKEGVPAVLLPAGEYVFDSTVHVPGGLTVLGEGAGTVIRPRDKQTHLFDVAGDHVRFTRLKLEGADTKRSPDNETYGIVVDGRKNVRVDHCELLGFSYATTFSGETLAQLDHCSIHHNLREGLGYGVAVYSGAYLLVTDCEFAQNRHSLASNGALDWSSGERIGKFVHLPGARKTHWEFVHNRVGADSAFPYECAVDTHPGMDGTFVVEANIFQGLQHGVGIRDGSGLIQGNVFRDLQAAAPGATPVAISITYSEHNGIPVEGAMPHDIQVTGNAFLGPFQTSASHSHEHWLPVKYDVGEAENISIDGALVPATRRDRPAPPPIPRLREMDDAGVMAVL